LWRSDAPRFELEVAVAKLIRCECGFVARGDDDDQVVTVLRGHLSSDHPALLDTVSSQDLLSWIQVE
jgi:predicted small metal-binding protein